MAMTRTMILLAAALMLTATACTKKYEDRYDHLRVDRTLLKLPPESGEIPRMVYYSGKWQAELDGECEWASIDATGGNGISAVHLRYDENILAARETFLIFSNGKDDPITINSTQNAGI